MLRSKLIEVLRSFTPLQFRQLKAFLNSPYFHDKAGEPVKELELYDFLAPHFPTFSENDISKEKAYAAIFSEQLYKKGKLEKLMSSFFKYVERFIQQEYVKHKSNDFQKEKALYRFYEENKLPRFYSLSMAKLEKNQEKIKRKDFEDYYQYFQLSQLISQFNSLRNKRNDDLNLPQTIFALDTFYLANRLELSSSLLAQKNFHNIIDTENALRLIPNLLKYAEESFFKKNPLIQAYAIACRILQNKGQDEKSTLKSVSQLDTILNKYADALPDLHLKTLHSFNRSFINRLINLDRKDLIPKAFNMYQDHLQKGMLFHQNKLHVGFLKNFVSLGLQLNKTEEVISLLRKFRNRLCGTAYPEDAYNYNLANYYFHIEQFEKAYNCLAHDYEDIYYKIAAKRLEVKIFYEQHSDLLEHKLNAFKLYIHRLSKKILPEIARHSNNNFINFLKQILAPSNNSKEKRKRIRTKILATEKLKEKEWLLKILDELF